MTDINTSLFIIGKFFFLFAFFLYLIFAGVVVRQVYLMTETLQVGFENPVKLISWIHFFFAIGVLIFVFLIL